MVRRGGGVTSRVEHQQQLHEMLLHRGNQRLQDEDISLTAVGVQLYIQAIVAEASNRGGTEFDTKTVTHFLRQRGVGAAAENGDLPHGITYDISLEADEDRTRSRCIVVIVV